MRRAVTVTFATLAIAVALLAPTPIESRAIAAPSCIPAAQCCKVCDAGQACGNSCISRNKQCHKGRGCACNASEICSAQP